MPSFGLAHPRGRFPFERLTAVALARLARFPSYRAPRAADLHDPTTFQPPAGPSSELVLSGRAFIASGSTRPDVRLVAVQPFVGELAACPHLRTLRRLDLTGNRIGPDGARALVASPFFGGLRELVLNGNAIGSEGAAALPGAPWLSGLERLEVAGNGLTANDVIRVLDAAPRVTAVDVSGNAADFAEVARRGMREVVAVGSTWGRLAAGQAQATGSRPHDRTATLASLDLRHTRVPPLGPCPALTHLNLGFTDCGDAFDAAAFPTLCVLGLRACRLARPAIRSASVAALDLSVNPLADAGAAVSRCPNVTHLNLANTGLSDAALAAVLAALPKLRVLDLAWNPLADPAPLLGHPTLQALDLTGTRFDRRGLRALAARFGTIGE
ncbi:leucine-rich repeat domain-containing protein [Urbifossiella limnaea]|uniref:Leucine Rich repeats (2 copies) n=1 Tax=Urbifossiella limnaea TaxID=2528023 RepID=A0A517XS22_9BACT|nr:hypothetical protein [Urbifossiella limnaea]QDU20307.1 Leucine Rich repeats (2 copies) [Urbifossiella limnaea]